MDGHVGDEVAQRGVVGAVKDEVVALQYRYSVGGGERDVVRDIIKERVDPAGWSQWGGRVGGESGRRAGGWAGGHTGAAT